MSKNKQMIMISPPMFIDGGIARKAYPVLVTVAVIVMATDISGKMG